MFQDPELETAYREGREGYPNRYDPDTPCSFAWQVGWNQAEQENHDAYEGELLCLKNS